jgi:hypothetical protein
MKDRGPLQDLQFMVLYEGVALIDVFGIEASVAEGAENDYSKFS